MGFKISVHIKHEIEYGTAGFDHCQAELFKLLKDNGCNIWTNDDCQEWGDEWEIQEEEFKNAVKRIAELPEEKVVSYFPDSKEKKEYVVSMLQTFADTGCVANGVYYFTWA